MKAALISHSSADILPDMTRTFSEWLDEIDRRRKRLFPKPLTRRQAQELDRLLTREDRMLVPKGPRVATRPLLDYRARMKAAGMKPRSKKATLRLDRLIAGE